MTFALAIAFGVVPTVLLAYLVFLVFFEKGIPYRVEAVDGGAAPLGSEAFLRVVASVADAELHRGSRIEALTSGRAFYEAQLEAIRGATRSVHLEQFIFREDAIATRFRDALVERAKAGAKVRLVLDWAGSFTTRDRFFAPLRAAGGEVAWYQPPRWYTFKHLTNRTHRKLLVVDGRVGFTGGAGIGEAWLSGEKGEPPWRDTMFRVEGALVAALQSCFLENWIETTGEILIRPDYFAAEMDDGGPGPRENAGVVVISAPQGGRSTRAHVVYQLLISSARRSIVVSTPYFVPDEPTQQALLAALRRGVSVRLVTCGKKTDHALARISARGRYGELLAAGAEIHEYGRGMLHTKAFVVDGLWSIVGSANLDNRSFALNDEVFIATRDAALAKAVVADFDRDARESERVTLDCWRKRGIFERCLAPCARLLDRQT